MLRNPTNMMVTNDYSIVYYFIGDDLYRYNEKKEDEKYESGKVRPHLGYWSSFFFWEDAFYAANSTHMFQVTRYYDHRIEPQVILSSIT